MVKKFNVSSCENKTTAIDINEKLQRGDGTEKADETMFRSVGSS